ncbi:hypothetical protein OAB01_03615, partial [Bacteroidia bacterium]|nr:hypothetical protein [Bacteroidia bacterium]
MKTKITNILSKRKTHSFFYLKTGFSALMMLFGLTAFGFNAGTYTIDNGSAASATNYTNFTSLANDLRGAGRTDGGAAQYAVGGSGLQGAIIVNVLSTTSFNEKVDFRDITSANSTNTITINGNGEMLWFNNTASSNTYTLQIDNTDYLTIDNLHVENRGTSYGKCIQIRDAAAYVTIKNCELTMPNLTGTSNYNAYIAATNGTASPYTSGVASTNLVIDNCDMHGRTGFGPWQGVFAASPSSTSTIYPLEVTNNKINDWRQHGVYTYYKLDPLIQDNEIWNDAGKSTGNSYSFSTTTSATARMLSGIYMHNYYKGGACRILDNDIHDIYQGSADLYQAGIVVHAPYGDNNTNIAKENKISGNTIDLTGAFYLYGIINNHYQGGLENGGMTIEDNDLSLDYTATSSYYSYGIYNYAYYTSSIGTININRNNLKMYGRGSGYGIYNYAYYAVCTGTNSISNNGIYSEKEYYWYGIYNYSPYINNNTRMNHNSMEVVKKTTGPSYYHYNYMPYYMPGEFKNNTLKWNGNIQYDAYGIYAYYLATPPIVQGNNINMPGNASTKNYLYDNNGGKTSHSDFVSYSGATNDLNTDPSFIDASTGNWTPISFAMANKGVSTAITDDINGTTRSTTNPDPGAVEYYLDVEALSTTFTGGPNECGNYTEEVTATFKNNSSFTISNVPVAFDVDGAGKVTGVVPGPIAAGASESFTFSSPAVFNNPGANSLNIYVDGSDDNPSNSTLVTVVNITSAPSGSKLTQDYNGTGPYPNGPIYNLSGNDVTIPGSALEYEFSAPAPNNSSSYTTYTTEWTASASVFTQGGTDVTGTTIASQGNSGNTYQVNVDPDVALTDSMLTLMVTFTDPVSGCDSTYNKD